MAPRTFVEATARQWQAVAKAVRERRVSLELTQAAAVGRSEGRISLPVWSIIERAKQANGRAERRSLTGITVALEWPPDAIDRLLDGKPPVDDPDPTPPPAASTGVGVGVGVGQHEISDEELEEWGFAALDGRILTPDEQEAAKRAAIAVVRAIRGQTDK